MKLIYNDLTSLNAQWLEPWWSEHFEIRSWDPALNYSVRDTVIYADFRNTHWTESFRQQGFKIVIDHLWDSYVDEPLQQESNVLTLRAKDWIWIEESMWFRHLGYHEYSAQPQQQNLFLLLMNLRKPCRDILYDATKKWHATSLVSYRGKGQIIPGDIDAADGNWQRYFNPKWYNETSFSIVSESKTSKRLWISEKIFKPLAHKHAFVVYGSPGSLNYLQKLGFETWHHLIDESYDIENNEYRRLEALCSTVSQLANQFDAGENLFSDAISREIIKHNFNHFYRQDILKNLFLQQILQPVMEFVYAR